MKETSSLLKTKIAPMKVLRQIKCSGCGEIVNEVEGTVALGPEAGKLFRAFKGCKCEEKRLAKESRKVQSAMLERKTKAIFNQNSLVNRSLQRATFENYEPTNKQLIDAKETVEEFVKEFKSSNPENLLLAGSYGTGKSHLSYAAVRALLDKGYSGLFLSVPKLLTKIKDTYNSHSEFSEAELLEAVEKVDLLVLDDIGTEYTNAKNKNDNWTQTKLFEVMDSRAGKHTIFTTNLSSDELSKKVNERNFSRMMDGTTVLKMTGKDYRRKSF
ncbi:ATP-binding protein [Bacillus sp. es.036]|uniref:ATP-binding protein n=1 Tax=Bacillus sp. es.036 TaxID=1761764 RepID=UPI000BF296CF|nr:ATP-binding protein [Bacillus sp. es.036]PFG13049.1 DNA replication protein DnaC [Bacillus sp. es.036]